eukprot:XP_001689690.1 predicted protein [Chlamydomonas reinhardtii]
MEVALAEDPRGRGAAAAEVRGRHPAAYAARGAEIAAEEEALAARRRRLRRLVVGNTHAYVPGGGEDEEAALVERVVVHLHPTFNPPVVVLTRPPFAVRRCGWGMFVVRAEVVFRPQWRHPPLYCRWLFPIPT